MYMQAQVQIQTRCGAGVGVGAGAFMRGWGEGCGARNEGAAALQGHTQGAHRQHKPTLELPFFLTTLLQRTTTRTRKGARHGLI